VIVDPDVTITWTITGPPVDDDSAEKQQTRAAEDDRLGFAPGDS
jgi:hypothetical protein